MTFGRLHKALVPIQVGPQGPQFGEVRIGKANSHRSRQVRHSELLVIG